MANPYAWDLNKLSGNVVEEEDEVEEIRFT